jgi:hypothetical protein
MAAIFMIFDLRSFFMQIHRVLRRLCASLLPLGNFHQRTAPLTWYLQFLRQSRVLVTPGADNLLFNSQRLLFFAVLRLFMMLFMYVGLTTLRLSKTIRKMVQLRAVP